MKEEGRKEGGMEERGGKVEQGGKGGEKEGRRGEGKRMNQSHTLDVK